MDTDPAAWAGESTKNRAMATKPVPSINLFFITSASLGKPRARHKEPCVHIMLNQEEFSIGRLAAKKQGPGVRQGLP